MTPVPLAREAPPARPRIADLDFSRQPFVVIWETTRACALACRHCRAEAVPTRHPGELTTAEAKAMMRRVRDFGRVVFVLSGGDCLVRPDVVELVEYGASLGLRMAMTPATTSRATRTMLSSLKDAGLARLAVSIDAASASSHDRFRRVEGSFAESLRILEECHAIGFPTQVNTVIGRHNHADFDALASLMGRLGIVFWEVFFMVPTGRAQRDLVATAASFERVFHRMYDLSTTASFDVKATAAPHYSRVVLQRQVAERRAGTRAAPADVLTGGVMFSLADGIGRARSVNDGDGFMFINHLGEICPSGFLPLAAGNVRTDDLVQVYQAAPLFTALRDRSRLQGKCGACEFRRICGGSRARAWAMTGDIHAAEPFCEYEPAAWRGGSAPS